MTAEYCNCTAHGCPLHGTMTRSTSGVKEDGAGWLCLLHFAAEGKRWPAITAELNRLGWLAAITRDLRARGWTNYGSHEKAIRLNQSSHLLVSDRENLHAYLIRLESALQQACAEPETAPIFDQKGK